MGSLKMPAEQLFQSKGVTKQNRTSFLAALQRECSEVNAAETHSTGGLMKNLTLSLLDLPQTLLRWRAHYEQNCEGRPG